MMEFYELEKNDQETYEEWYGEKSKDFEMSENQDFNEWLREQFIQYKVERVEIEREEWMEEYYLIWSVSHDENYQEFYRLNYQEFLEENSSENFKKWFQEKSEKESFRGETWVRKKYEKYQSIKGEITFQEWWKNMIELFKKIDDDDFKEWLKNYAVIEDLEKFKNDEIIEKKFEDYQIQIDSNFEEFWNEVKLQYQNYVSLHPDDYQLFLDWIKQWVIVNMESLEALRDTDQVQVKFQMWKKLNQKSEESFEEFWNILTIDYVNDCQEYDKMDFLEYTAAYKPKIDVLNVENFQQNEKIQEIFQKFQKIQKKPKKFKEFWVEIKKEYQEEMYHKDQKILMDEWLKEYVIKVDDLDEFKDNQILVNKFTRWKSLNGKKDVDFENFWYTIVEQYRKEQRVKNVDFVNFISGFEIKFLRENLEKFKKIQKVRDKFEEWMLINDYGEDQLDLFWNILTEDYVSFIINAEDPTEKSNKFEKWIENYEIQKLTKFQKMKNSKILRIKFKEWRNLNERNKNSFDDFWKIISDDYEGQKDDIEDLKKWIGEYKVKFDVKHLDHFKEKIIGNPKFELWKSLNGKKNEDFEKFWNMIVFIYQKKYLDSEDPENFINYLNDFNVVSLKDLIDFKKSSEVNSLFEHWKKLNKKNNENFEEFWKILTHDFIEDSQETQQNFQQYIEDYKVSYNEEYLEEMKNSENFLLKFGEYQDKTGNSNFDQFFKNLKNLFLEEVSEETLPFQIWVLKYKIQESQNVDDFVNTQIIQQKFKEWQLQNNETEDDFDIFMDSVRRSYEMEKQREDYVSILKWLPEAELKDMRDPEDFKFSEKVDEIFKKWKKINLKKNDSFEDFWHILIQDYEEEESQVYFKEWLETYQVQLIQDISIYRESTTIQQKFKKWQKINKNDNFEEFWEIIKNKWQLTGKKIEQFLNWLMHFEVEIEQKSVFDKIFKNENFLEKFEDWCEMNGKEEKDLGEFKEIIREEFNDQDDYEEWIQSYQVKSLDELEFFREDPEVLKIFQNWSTKNEENFEEFWIELKDQYYQSQENLSEEKITPFITWLLSYSIYTTPYLQKFKNDQYVIRKFQKWKKLNSKTDQDFGKFWVDLCKNYSETGEDERDFHQWLKEYKIEKFEKITFEKIEKNEIFQEKFQKFSKKNGISFDQESQQNFFNQTYGEYQNSSEQQNTSYIDWLVHYIPQIDKNSHFETFKGNDEILKFFNQWKENNGKKDSYFDKFWQEYLKKYKEYLEEEEEPLEMDSWFRKQDVKVENPDWKILLNTDLVKSKFKEWKSLNGKNESSKFQFNSLLKDTYQQSKSPLNFEQWLNQYTVKIDIKSNFEEFQHTKLTHDKFQQWKRAKAKKDEDFPKFWQIITQKYHHYLLEHKNGKIQNFEEFLSKIQIETKKIFNVKNFVKEFELRQKLDEWMHLNHVDTSQSEKFYRLIGSEYHKYLESNLKPVPFLDWIKSYKVEVDLSCSMDSFKSNQQIQQLFKKWKSLNGMEDDSFEIFWAIFFKDFQKNNNKQTIDQFATKYTPLQMNQAHFDAILETSGVRDKLNEWLEINGEKSDKKTLFSEELMREYSKFKNEGNEEPFLIWIDHYIIKINPECSFEKFQQLPQVKQKFQQWRRINHEECDTLDIFWEILIGEYKKLIKEEKEYKRTFFKDFIKNYQIKQYPTLDLNEFNKDDQVKDLLHNWLFINGLDDSQSSIFYDQLQEKYDPESGYYVDYLDSYQVQIWLDSPMDVYQKSDEVLKVFESWKGLNAKTSKDFEEFWENLKKEWRESQEEKEQKISLIKYLEDYQPQQTVNYKVILNSDPPVPELVSVYQQWLSLNQLEEDDENFEIFKKEIKKYYTLDKPQQIEREPLVIWLTQYHPKINTELIEQFRESGATREIFKEWLYKTGKNEDDFEEFWTQVTVNYQKQMYGAEKVQLFSQWILSHELLLDPDMDFDVFQSHENVQIYYEKWKEINGNYEKSFEIFWKIYVEKYRKYLKISKNSQKAFFDWILDQEQIWDKESLNHIKENEYLYDDKLQEFNTVNGFEKLEDGQDLFIEKSLDFYKKNIKKLKNDKFYEIIQNMPVLITLKECYDNFQDNEQINTLREKWFKMNYRNDQEAQDDFWDELIEQYEEFIKEDQLSLTEFIPHFVILFNLDKNQGIIKDDKFLHKFQKWKEINGIDEIEIEKFWKIFRKDFENSEEIDIWKFLEDYSVKYDTSTDIDNFRENKLIKDKYQEWIMVNKLDGDHFDEFWKIIKKQWSQENQKKGFLHFLKRQEMKVEHQNIEHYKNDEFIRQIYENYWCQSHNVDEESELDFDIFWDNLVRNWEEQLSNDDQVIFEDWVFSDYLKLIGKEDLLVYQYDPEIHVKYTQWLKSNQGGDFDIFWEQLLDYYRQHKDDCENLLECVNGWKIKKILIL